MLGHSDQNLSTETDAVSVVLKDPHFQKPDKSIKATVLEYFAIKGQHTIRTFDVVRTDTNSAASLTSANIEEYLPQVRLGEIKATKAPIKDNALNGFFFGATETEFALARALGAHYIFLFVVLSSSNVYGRPFFVPLTLAQVENRTRSRRIQYQVNFRTDMSIDQSSVGDWVSFPGYGGVEIWPHEDAEPIRAPAVPGPPYGYSQRGTRRRD